MQRCPEPEKILTRYGYCLYYGGVLDNFAINPRTPVAQKLADGVVFRRFQSERVDFFKSDLTDPILAPFKPFQLSFFSEFLYQDLL